jgi:hypothetical protein
MTEEEYIAQRLDDQIDWYSKKSSSQTLLFQFGVSQQGH